MADMGIKNGKVSYLDTSGNVIYNLPTTGTNGNMDLLYTPTTDADWNTVPTNVAAALDEIAARLTALGG